MNLLVPGALGLASLALPLVVLYMLRSRRRRTEVPSTLLWAGLEESVTSAVPWKRLEVTPLLLLQLAVLALFVLALTRPFFTQATLLGPHSVFVIDTSGSMAMSGRLDRAKRQAKDLAADAGTANLVSVVEAGPSPHVVAAFAQNPDAIIQAIEGLEPTGGVADLSGAIRLARGLATPDRPTGLVLFTDGGEGPLAEEPVLGAAQVPFDESGENLSIAAFTAEPSTEGTVRLFTAVANHTGREHDVALEVVVGALPAGAVEMTVPPLGQASQVLPVEAAPGDVVSIRRVGEPDALAMDDAAWLILGSGPDRTVRVTGQGSPFLDAVVEASPGFRMTGEDEPGEILVVDGGELPEIDRPAWVIRTDEPPTGMDVTELITNAPATYQRPGEPILDSVDLSDLVVADAQVVATTTWLPIVRAGDVPLILLGEVGGNRVAYFTFDLVHSNLPVQVGFPILGARLLQWLEGGTGGAVSSAVAGEPLALSPPAGAEVEVTVPDGSIRRLEGTVAGFEDTGRPGVYRTSYLMPDGSRRPGPAAVRTFAPSESAATSRRIATSAAAGGVSRESTLVREWAPWIVAAALVLMAVEWWVAHQRPGLRRARPAP